MKTSRMAVVGLAAGFACLCVLSLTWPAEQSAQADQGAQSAVDRSVEKAVEYLKKCRAGNHWEFQIPSKEYSTGLTALCTLSLIEAGVPRTDPVVASGARYVRDQLSALSVAR